MDRIEEWDNKPGLDEDDPGEVQISFPTKGAGWSGRDQEQDEDD